MRPTKKTLQVRSTSQVAVFSKPKIKHTRKVHSAAPWVSTKFELKPTVASFRPACKKYIS